jgi:Short C-terminal domain/PEGA domain
MKWITQEQTLKQNNNTAFTYLLMLLPLAVSLTLLPACSTNPFRSDQTDPGKQGRIISVTSSPSGATVRANGNKLGVTPMTVNIDKSFPSSWVRAEDYGIVYRVSGKLTIEKNGCEDYTVPVSHTAPADDVNVTLVCKEEKPMPGPAETVKPVMSENMEQRLKKLDKLYRDGVISSEEYNQHRNRILGEL